MRSPLVSLLCVAFAPACGDAPAPAPSAPVALEHDFGTIPHGQVRDHDFVVPTEAHPGCYPLGFQTSCSCGKWEFVVRGADGTERPTGVDITEGQREVRAGEQLVLRLQIDTRRREPVDVDAATFRGTVVLKLPSSDEPQRIPVSFRYAIDAPIRVQPFAHVDFGALPHCLSFPLTLELHPDRTDPPVRLGPVQTSDPRLTASLREQDGVTLLDMKFTPAATDRRESVETAIYVDTDLPSYTLAIPVTGQITGAIAIEPTNHIGFNRIDFAGEAERFVFITDHDVSRPAAFAVFDILDVNGASLADHFHAELLEVEGAARMTKLVLRYSGGLTGNSLRGVVRLVKPKSTDPLVEITFNAINAK